MMKKNVQKLLALLLTAAVVFSFAACGGKNDDETTTAADGTTQAVTEAGVSVEDSTGTTKALPSGSEQDKIIRDALGKDVQWDGDFKKLTDEQKQKVKDAFKDEGYIVDVTDDGVSVENSTGTTIPGETTTEGSGESTTADSSQPGVSTTAAQVSNKKPETKAEILEAYTKVMNNAKSKKPGFTKNEYQVLPENERKVGGAVKYLLPLADLFMTKKDAKKATQVIAKGENMNSFPVKNATKGCMLTNTGAIKSAKCDVLSNGNYKITIILNDEMNPEPYKSGQAKASSNTGNMFSPLGKSDIDNELKNNGTVKRVIKEANYSLKYRNCTATLEYDPKTNHIVSLKQYTNTFIDMSGRIALLGEASGTAVLEMYYNAYDFKY